MPSPSRRDMHQSQPLRDFTVATLQDEASFICGQAQQFQEVEHRKDDYYVYDSGAWNKLQMQPRGVGEPSKKGKWTLSTGNYNCAKRSVGKVLDWDDTDDADEALDLDQAAAEWGANQIRMQCDSLLASNVFAASLWTTDWTGVAASPAANQILQWNDSSSDPQNDFQTLQGTFQSLIGKQANLMIVGQDVHREVLTNPQVRDAIKYTDPTMINVVNSKLAAYFGVERYMVAGSFQNTAEFGQTASYAALLDADDVWAGYVDPAPKKMTLTAWKVFAWNGKRGNGSQGVRAWKYDDSEKQCTTYDWDLNIDIKLIAADAGAFISGAVA